MVNISEPEHKSLCRSTSQPGCVKSIQPRCELQEALLPLGLFASLSFLVARISVGCYCHHVIFLEHPLPSGYRLPFIYIITFTPLNNTGGKIFHYSDWLMRKLRLKELKWVAKGSQLGSEGARTWTKHSDPRCPVLNPCTAPLSPDRWGFPALHLLLLTWLWTHFNNEWYVQIRENLPPKFNGVFFIKCNVSCCWFPPCYSDMWWLQKTCRFQTGILFNPNRPKNKE